MEFGWFGGFSAEEAGPVDLLVPMFGTRDYGCDVMYWNQMNKI